MELEQESCPSCERDLTYEAETMVGEDSDGKPITGTGRFSHKTGVVIPSVYDGALYWMCPFCGHKWQRWPEGDALNEIAKKFVDSPLY